MLCSVDHTEGGSYGKEIMSTDGSSFLLHHASPSVAIPFPVFRIVEDIYTARHSRHETSGNHCDTSERQRKALNTSFTCSSTRNDVEQRHLSRDLSRQAFDKITFSQHYYRESKAATSIGYSYSYSTGYLSTELSSQHHIRFCFPVRNRVVAKSVSHCSIYTTRQRHTESKKQWSIVGLATSSNI